MVGRGRIPSQLLRRILQTTVVLAPRRSAVNVRLHPLQRRQDSSNYCQLASLDNCGPVTVTQSPAAGTPVGLGPHTVTVTATDGAGNSSSDTVIFTVNDTTAPTVTAPADSSASANASCMAAIPNYASASTASDNCGPVTVTQSPAAGTMVDLTAHR